MLLPKKLTSNSRINFVHTSSPVSQADMNYFDRILQQMKKDYRFVRIYDVQRKDLDPRYLAASEKERLHQFRLAIRKADWLAPIYGGTGCADIIRYLSVYDLLRLRKNRPIVNGFSDTTFLINFLYFKIKLLTFHYSNAWGLFNHDNVKQFFDIISGRINQYQYLRPAYEWLTPNKRPKKLIEGIAIGGNLSTFRDLLDICDIEPASWKNYILFFEDVGADMEDLHRILIALDQRNIFLNCKAIVLGKMDEKSFDSAWLKLNRIFGRQQQADHLFEYLISDVIAERLEDDEIDPLYILKVDNLGHGIYKDAMIIPIGGKTRIHPNGKIEFIGPFVR